MWLINVNTFKLEHKLNPEHVRYMILSHTWGEDEVGFQEFTTLNGNHSAPTTRSGLLKIRAAYELARRLGLLYAWVDTCYIDKSSSAELSEAINSMFNWYAMAKVCIVYLEDLPADVPFTSGLSKCRWITRGWTLQELIAPWHVEFYDLEWRCRGSKTTNLDAIKDVTGVSEGVLRNRENMYRVPVAVRMSWMSRRQTTRVEDTAYCMLGIFDINMPMLYGEGTKAFLRLQEDIVRQSYDLSLFAWQTGEAKMPYRDFHSVFSSSPS